MLLVLKAHNFDGGVILSEEEVIIVHIYVCIYVCHSYL